MPLPVVWDVSSGALGLCRMLEVMTNFSFVWFLSYFKQGRCDLSNFRTCTYFVSS